MRNSWAGHASPIESSEMHTKFQSENITERDQLEESGIDERIIL
jgi:hypothetical protein